MHSLIIYVSLSRNYHWPSYSCMTLCTQPIKLLAGEFGGLFDWQSDRREPTRGRPTPATDLRSPPLPARPLPPLPAPSTAAPSVYPACSSPTLLRSHPASTIKVGRWCACQGQAEKLARVSNTIRWWDAWLYFCGSCKASRIRVLQMNVKRSSFPRRKFFNFK